MLFYFIFLLWSEKELVIFKQTQPKKSQDIEGPWANLKKGDPITDFIHIFTPNHDF